MLSQNAMIRKISPHKFQLTRNLPFSSYFGSFTKISISLTLMKAYVQSIHNFPINTLKFDIKLSYFKSVSGINFSSINQII